MVKLSSLTLACLPCLEGVTQGSQSSAHDLMCVKYAKTLTLQFTINQFANLQNHTGQGFLI